MTLFESLKSYQVSHLSLHAWKDISLKTYDHLLILDAQFHLASSQKSRLFSLYKAHQYIEKNVRQLLGYLLPLVFDFVISSAYLYFYFGGEFFSIFLSAGCLYAFWTMRTSAIRRPFIMKQKKMDKRADFVVSESLANFHTVKYFNAEKIQSGKYEKALEKYISYNMQNVFSLGKLNLGQKLIFSFGICINLILAVLKVQSGALTMGDVVFLQALMVQIMNPLNFLGNFYREHTESMIEMRELFNLLDQKPKYELLFYYFIFKC
jgi:ABC-type transport system involved in Fe-S cluster assembly fused permease/ATPase subunit